MTPPYCYLGFLPNMIKCSVGNGLDRSGVSGTPPPTAGQGTALKFIMVPQSIVPYTQFAGLRPNIYVSPRRDEGIAPYRKLYYLPYISKQQPT